MLTSYLPWLAQQKFSYSSDTGFSLSSGVTPKDSTKAPPKDSTKAPPKDSTKLSFPEETFIYNQKNKKFVRLSLFTLFERFPSKIIKEIDHCFIKGCNFDCYSIYSNKKQRLYLRDAPTNSDERYRIKTIKKAYYNPNDFNKQCFIEADVWFYMLKLRNELHSKIDSTVIPDSCEGTIDDKWNCSAESDEDDDTESEKDEKESDEDDDTESEKDEKDSDEDDDTESEKDEKDSDEDDPLIKKTK